MILYAGVISFQSMEACKHKEKVNNIECELKSIRGKRKRTNECATRPTSSKNDYTAWKRSNVGQALASPRPRKSLKACSAPHSSGEMNHLEWSSKDTIKNQIAKIRQSLHIMQKSRVDPSVSSYILQQGAQSELLDKAPEHTEHPTDEGKSTRGITQVPSRNPLHGIKLEGSSAGAIPTDAIKDRHNPRCIVTSPTIKQNVKEDLAPTASNLVQTFNFPQCYQGTINTCIDEDCNSDTTEYAVSFALSEGMNMCDLEEVTDSCNSASSTAKHNLQDDMHAGNILQRTQRAPLKAELGKQDESQCAVQLGLSTGTKGEHDILLPTDQNGNKLDHGTEQPDLVEYHLSKLSQRPDIFDVLSNVFSEKGDFICLALCKHLQQYQITAQNCK